MSLADEIKLPRNKNFSEQDVPNNFGGASCQARHSIQQLGATVMETAQEKLHEFREMASGMCDDGIQQAKELSNEFEQYVRKEPAKGLLIAGAVGFALGLLLIRK